LKKLRLRKKSRFRRRKARNSSVSLAHLILVSIQMYHLPISQDAPEVRPLIHFRSTLLKEQETHSQGRTLLQALKVFVGKFIKSGLSWILSLRKRKDNNGEESRMQEEESAEKSQKGNGRVEIWRVEHREERQESEESEASGSYRSFGGWDIKEKEKEEEG